LAALEPQIATLAPDASSDATALEVRTDDRPGLVHDLGRALASVGISVRSAHIATSAGQAMDTLYLLDRDGSALAPARVAQAVAALMEACEVAL
jgi:[protein-PII] uridylyltransferase